jgi:hypothetical protein
MQGIHRCDQGYQITAGKRGVEASDSQPGGQREHGAGRGGAGGTLHSPRGAGIP